MEMKNIFPEIEKIEDKILQGKVIKSLEKAISMGGWKEEDSSIDSIYPFDTRIARRR